MFNCYEMENSMWERYNDLWREGEEERLACMVASGQRRQHKSLLQVLSRQVGRAIT